MNILVTVCARKGSKGIKGKNLRSLLDKPLIAHSIELALNWHHSNKVIVSTDSEEIAEVAKSLGAEVPFLRPDELATDTAGKVPVLVHALKACEEFYQEHYDILLDLDATSPIRSKEDLDNGYETFCETRPDVCFSVVPARKNPYFNMVERDASGKVGLVKALNNRFLSRQSAPEVWDMNASIYFYARDFLLQNPNSIWGNKVECFEMPADTAFDIDEERDFVVVESLMQARRQSL